MRPVFGLMIMALILTLAAVAVAAEEPRSPAISFHGGNLTCAFAEVQIRNGTFEPATVYVYKNATVVWVNPGPEEHAISFADEISPPILAGESYTKNFHELGTFNYTCRYHTSEMGMVIVR